MPCLNVAFQSRVPWNTEYQYYESHLFLIILTLILASIFPMSADARSRSHTGGDHSHTSSQISQARTVRHLSPKTNYGVARDSRGRLKRSSRAKSEFKYQHPCPSTGKSSGPCPGYVVDHVRALKRGGEDSPSNMQWQTKEAAKAKDRWE